MIFLNAKRMEKKNINYSNEKKYNFPLVNKKKKHPNIEQKFIKKIFIKKGALLFKNAPFFYFISLLATKCVTFYNGSAKIESACYKNRNFGKIGIKMSQVDFFL
jgi:hypothetical protein